MSEEGKPYKGAIYAGVMISDGHPKVLEFNARFGDPETQPVLMRMKGDIIPILEACIKGDLSKWEIEWDNRAAVCVVMASRGYPGDYEKGKAISGLKEVSQMKDVFVFHAGTALEKGRMVTHGGRVLGVTGLGESIPKAIEKTYEAVRMISWDGVHYRTDIGQKALQIALAKKHKYSPNRTGGVICHGVGAKSIAVIPGDGTGPEVVAEGLKVLKVASEKFNFKYELVHYDLGAGTLPQDERDPSRFSPGGAREGGCHLSGGDRSSRCEAWNSGEGDTCWRYGFSWINISI